MWVDGDVTQLMQAFMNIIGNAIKYTPESGRIKTALSKTDREVTVTVSDSGKGISSENLDKIFELFYQESPSRNKKQDGLGIGLFLVNQIIKEHGGSVGVASPGDGEGSEFVIRLPLVDESTRTVGQ